MSPNNVLLSVSLLFKVQNIFLFFGWFHNLTRSEFYKSWNLSSYPDGGQLMGITRHVEAVRFTIGSKSLCPRKLLQQLWSPKPHQPWLHRRVFSRRHLCNIQPSIFVSVQEHTKANTTNVISPLLKWQREKQIIEQVSAEFWFGLYFLHKINLLCAV